MSAKGRRFVICGDSHGDCVDPVSASALWAFLRDYKPEVKVHLGDCWDFRNLRKGASDDEKAASLENDWGAGTEFLNQFFDKRSENHLLYGNHDARIFDFRNSATGLLRDYAHDGVKRMEALMKRLNIQTLPYDSALGILHLGRLSLLHGYHAGIGAVRQHAAIYGNCVIGHVHSIESAPVPSISPAEARSIGCMCIRDMDYINKKTAKLRWANGFAYGVLFENGEYQLFQTRKIDGQFYAATEIKCFG